MPLTDRPADGAVNRGVGASTGTLAIWWVIPIVAGNLGGCLPAAAR